MLTPHSFRDWAPVYRMRLHGRSDSNKESVEKIVKYCVLSAFLEYRNNQKGK